MRRSRRRGRVATGQWPSVLTNRRVGRGARTRCDRGRAEVMPWSGRDESTVGQSSQEPLRDGCHRLRVRGTKTRRTRRHLTLARGRVWGSGLRTTNRSPGPFRRNIFTEAMLHQHPRPAVLLKWTGLVTVSAFDLQWNRIQLAPGVGNIDYSKRDVMMRRSPSRIFDQPLCFLAFSLRCLGGRLICLFRRSLVGDSRGVITGYRQRGSGLRRT